MELIPYLGISEELEREREETIHLALRKSVRFRVFLFYTLSIEQQFDRRSMVMDEI